MAFAPNRHLETSRALGARNLLREGGAMKLVGITPRIGSLPELRTFRYPECDHV
jgi:hypothetical protein